MGQLEMWHLDSVLGNLRLTHIGNTGAQGVM